MTQSIVSLLQMKLLFVKVGNTIWRSDLGTWSYILGRLKLRCPFSNQVAKSKWPFGHTVLGFGGEVRLEKYRCVIYAATSQSMATSGGTEDEDRGPEIKSLETRG